MTDSISHAYELTSKLREEVNKRVFGMDDVLDSVLMALYAGGHIILQGVPGTAKTRLLKSVAEAVDVPFERIQMTVDLLPSDIVGQEVRDPISGNLEFRKGPIFTGILLADELNRATPKTKSAILEPMAERQVTLTVRASDGSGNATERKIPLPEEFTVFATQNPLEQMGTYPLAEAERDRFLMKKIVGYVSEEDELAIATLPFTDDPINKVMQKKDLLSIRSVIAENVYINEHLLRKMLRMVRMTRPTPPGEEGYTLANNKLDIGASPRAFQALEKTSRVLAFLRGRDHVIPEDVMDLGYSIFCHRVIFSSRRKDEWDSILKNLLQEIYARVFGGVGG